MLMSLLIGTEALRSEQAASKNQNILQKRQNAFRIPHSEISAGIGDAPEIDNS